jgi:hypothetical protein
MGGRVDHPLHKERAVAGRVKERLMAFVQSILAQVAALCLTEVMGHRWELGARFCSRFQIAKITLLPGSRLVEFPSQAVDHGPLVSCKPLILIMSGLN